MTAPKIGILGGGQLGRMMIPAALKLGYELWFLDPHPQAAVAPFSRNLRHGDFTDAQTVKDFAKQVDVLTYEIESVSIEGLQAAEKGGTKVFPKISTLQIAQDKGAQKNFFAHHNLPTAPFVLASASEISQVVANRFPDGAVQKQRRGGYDGRGVKILNGLDSTPLKTDSVVEQTIAVARELAQVIVRDQQGNIAFYDPVEMEFDPDLHLVMSLKSPAKLDGDQAKKVQTISRKIAEKIDLVGVSAVEFFETKTGEILVNEIAPRVHNSGHLTIETTPTSQFENHLRSIVGDPLGSTQTLMPARMHNLVGDRSGVGLLHNWDRHEVMNHPDLHWHWYGKTIRPGRKVGHITELLERCGL